MPTYEYKCTNCGYEIEILHGINDKPLKQCDNCSLSTLKRGVGGGCGLSFQGSGFYVTDYAGK